MPFLTQQNFDQMPEWLRNSYKDTISRAESLHGEAYPEYKKERIAPINEDIQRAQALGRQTGQHLPFYQQAHRLASEAATPFSHRYQEYMNPYQQHVVENIAKMGNRNFKENILPALENKFVRLGQIGGTRHAKLARQAARDLQSEIMDRQSQALMQGYDESARKHAADQARALEAARGISEIGGLYQGANLADIAALEGQGRQQQQHQQAIRDLAYENFIRAKEHPFNMLQYFQNILHGVPQERVYSGYQQHAGQPYTNTWGQVGNLAANILGSRMAASGR